MKKAFFLLAFALFAAKHGLAQPLLTFKIEVQKPSEGPVRTEVEMVFPAGPDGETRLVCPPDFGAATQLFRSLKNPRPLESRTKIAWSADSSQLIVRSPQGLERVGIRYEIAQSFSARGFRQETVFQPFLQQNWLHVLGNNLFLAPEAGDRWLVDVKKINLPVDWQAASSWPDAPFSTTTMRLREHVFLAGDDVRILKTEIEKKPLTVAVRGKWAFSDADLLAEIKTTVAQQRAFWQDFDIPKYTVTLAPIKDDLPLKNYRPGEIDVEFCGAGLASAFAAFSTNNPTTDLTHLRHLFHHELMHDWIGGKIRPGGDGYNDMEMAWFSEGFTEYFAYRNMLAVGHLAPEDFLHAVNEDFFQALWQSPMADAPNSEIKKRFFESPEARDLPYKRGFCFAFWLDLGIRKKSKNAQNLRDLMLQMLDYYQQGDRELRENMDFFFETAEEMSGLDVEKMHQKNIVEGRLIEAEAFRLPDFLAVEKGSDRVPRFVGNEAVSWESKI